MAKKKGERASAVEIRAWLKPEDLDVICRAWVEYVGLLEVFESAVGALVVGRFGGYDVLRLLHGSRTLRRYETILNISFKERLPSRTKDSSRMHGIRRADKFQQFWKALAGGVGSEPGAKAVST
jgi:hypothetical protein